MATGSDSRNNIQIAILDDYAAVSTTYFKPLLDKYSGRGITIDYLPDTVATSTTGSGLTVQVHRLQQYTIISTMRERTKFPAELISQLPNLKLLLTMAMRNASIDVAQCQKQGVIVAGTAGHGGGPKRSVQGDTTNEQTWALILGLMRGLPADDLRVKTNALGGWQDGVAHGLAGRTIGILGLGRLGLQCAVTAYWGFGMDVVCWSMNLTQEQADEKAESRGLPKGVLKVAASKEEFFRSADLVSVHYVLSDRSRGIVGETELGWMKKTAFLVNTSRAPLIDEAALLRALQEKTIRGVGLDVFEVEPLPADSPWRTEQFGKRLVLSPHMGYVEEETMNNWYKQTAENVERWLKEGEVINVIQQKP